LLGVAKTVSMVISAPAGFSRKSSSQELIRKTIDERNPAILNRYINCLFIIDYF
jgi:hypothetical protein